MARRGTTTKDPSDEKSPLSRPPVFETSTKHNVSSECRLTGAYFDALHFPFWPAGAGGGDSTPIAIFQKAKGKLPAPPTKEPTMETVL
jgi:hypothetical protein